MLWSTYFPSFLSRSLQEIDDDDDDDEAVTAPSSRSESPFSDSCPSRINPLEEAEKFAEFANRLLCQRLFTSPNQRLPAAPELKKMEEFLESAVSVKQLHQTTQQPIENPWFAHQVLYLIVKHHLTTPENRSPLALEILKNLEKGILKENRNVKFSVALRLVVENQGAALQPVLSPNERDRNGETMLHWAARHGDLPLAQQLLNLDVTVDDPGEATWAPLYLAVALGRREVAKLLIDRGADVNRKETRFGHAPLHCIDNVEMTELLIEHGANVNQIDDNNESPLHKAAFHGRTKVAKLLLQHQADVTAENDHGNSALHEAVLEGRTEVAELLIDHGAEVDSKNQRSRTPIHYAISSRNLEIFKLLIDATIHEKNILSLRMNLLRSVEPKRKLEKGGKLNAQLHEPVNSRHAIVQLLFKNDKEVDSSLNHPFHTPSHPAINDHDLDLFNWLVEKTFREQTVSSLYTNILQFAESNNASLGEDFLSQVREKCLSLTERFRQ